MDVHDVQAVDAQPRQAVLQRPFDPVGAVVVDALDHPGAGAVPVLGESAGAGHVLEPPADLGRQHVAVARHAAQRGADPPLAGARPVQRGGIDEVDAGLQGGAHDLRRLLVGDVAVEAADRRAPQAHPGHLQVRRSEPYALQRIHAFLLAYPTESAWSELRCRGDERRRGTLLRLDRTTSSEKEGDDPAVNLESQAAPMRCVRRQRNPPVRPFDVVKMRFREIPRQAGRIEDATGQSPQARPIPKRAPGEWFASMVSHVYENARQTEWATLRKAQSGDKIAAATSPQRYRETLATTWMLYADFKECFLFLPVANEHVPWCSHEPSLSITRHLAPVYQQTRPAARRRHSLASL